MNLSWKMFFIMKTQVTEKSLKQWNPSMKSNFRYYRAFDTYALEIKYQLKRCKWFSFLNRNRSTNMYFLIEVLSTTTLVSGMICCWLYNMCLRVRFFTQFRIYTPSSMHFSKMKKKTQLNWHFMMFWLWWAVLSMQCIAQKIKQQKQKRMQIENMIDLNLCKY